MEELHKRFEQGGGLYNYQLEENKEQYGGKEELSPRSDNWKKKYLEIKIELDNLKEENKKLKTIK